MSDTLDLFFRGYTIPATRPKKCARNRDALIFRCATTTATGRELLFGAYICAKLKDGQFVADEIGLFHRDGHRDDIRVFENLVMTSAYELTTVTAFREQVFLKYLKAGALVVAYDAPSEICRIAVKVNESRKQPRAFSFYFRTFKDKKTGKMRPSQFVPGLSIESLDASKAIYRLIKYKFQGVDSERKQERPVSSAHVLDLRTLASALTGEAYSFRSACEAFGVESSKAQRVRSRVTKPEIERQLRDVVAELELLNRLFEKYSPHAF